MKEIGSLLIIGLALCLFQRCGNQTKNHDKEDDSTIVIKDTAAASDTAPKMHVTAEGGDIKFAVTAASSGMAEVELGKMAQQKGADKRIRNFGAMMIKDHSKADGKLAALADAKNIILPYNPAGNDQKTIDDLKAKSGKDFDKAYVEAMIEDHKKDIKVFENASKNCQDPDIKAFAAKTLPMLRNHLDAIYTIQEGMK
jgi:putative membrane protein